MLGCGNRGGRAIGPGDARWPGHGRGGASRVEHPEVVIDIPRHGGGECEGHSPRQCAERIRHIGKETAGRVACFGHFGIIGRVVVIEVKGDSIVVGEDDNHRTVVGVWREDGREADTRLSRDAVSNRATIRPVRAVKVPDSVLVLRTDKGISHRIPFRERGGRGEYPVVFAGKVMHFGL